jgi:RNA polymerase sigma-70 factor (ECF subfamily)
MSRHAKKRSICEESELGMNVRGEVMTDWEGHYRAHRNFLVSYAFRMTGSLADAEDIVQDTVSECLKFDPAVIKNHRAWMTRICANKSLDLLKSSARRKNKYIGTWLPDAIPETLNTELLRGIDVAADAKVELSESLAMSFLILLQTLSPVERSIFLLKDIFDYSFKEVSELVGKSEVACRKIAERARKSMTGHGRIIRQTSPDSEAMIGQFFEAAKLGDRALLMALLSEKSEFLTDGGGKAPAAPPMIGIPGQIADFFLASSIPTMFKSSNFRLEAQRVNAGPGFVISKQGPDGMWSFESIISFEIAANKIARIYAQRNPDKLNSILKMVGRDPRLFGSKKIA